MGLRRQVLAAFALAAAPLALTACSGGKVTDYTVPKEKDPELPAAGPASAPGGEAQPGMGGSMAGTPVPTAGGAALTWDAPGAWQVKPASAMRKGSYAVPGPGGAGDLSITAFPGDVGGELANINRWRGQVGLPPLTDEGLAGASERFRINGLQFVVVDLASDQSPKRLLGAIVPFGDGTWFFKLMGPDKLVAAQKGAFLDFLRTVKPAPGP
jgi:hypothetical protein